MKNKIPIIFVITLLFGFFYFSQNSVFAVSPKNSTSTESSTALLIQELQATIEGLRNQIKELQDQFAKLTTEVEEVKEELKLTKNLYKGLSDEEVKKLQEFLKQYAEVYPEGLVTGYFGQLTEKAVKKFQEQYDIPATGLVGPLTREKIKELSAEEKVVICHYPLDNPANKHTLEIGEPALGAHLAHGDTLGACPQEPAPTVSTPTPPTPAPTTPSPATPTPTPTSPPLVDLQQKIADILQRLEDLKAPQLSSSTAPVSVGSITQFVTFGGFVNAVTADGSVLCWDSLGVRTISYRVLLLCNLKSVASIAPGDDHSCAVKKDGSAICWGHNYYGQLGNGTFDDKATQIPVSVSGLGPGTTASITVGSSHTCALKTDGSVVCWGNNNSSQLGDGTLEGRFTPVQVVGLGPGTTATLFTSDGGSTCAQKTNGSIVCWGQNSLIGYDNHTAPVQATQFAAGTVESLDFSFKRSCVLKTDGSVVCSGSNYCGQLGNNQGKNAVTLGPGTAVAVSNGEFHSCALKRDGSVVCWGCNENGQVGDGTVTNRYIPVQVSGLGPGTTAAISAHFLNTCALKTDGVVVCWPYGGKEGEKSSRTPVLAPSLTGQ